MRRIAALFAVLLAALSLSVATAAPALAVTGTFTHTQVCNAAGHVQVDVTISLPADTYAKTYAASTTIHADGQVYSANGRTATFDLGTVTAGGTVDVHVIARSGRTSDSYNLPQQTLYALACTAP